MSENGKRLRVAWFSPSSDHPGSLASYATRELLPALTEYCEIELFTERAAPAEGSLPQSHHYLCASERHGKSPYDLFFYQLEDRPEANFLRIALAQNPGIVWFHDLFFTTHGPEPILNSAWHQLLKRFHDRVTPWPDPFDEHPQEKPFARRAASFTLLPIFSNERDRAQYLSLQVDDLIGRNAPDRSFFLPLPVREQTGKARWNEAFEVAVCGSARIEHRAHILLQALKEEGISAERIAWMIAPDEEPRAKELLQEFSLLGVKLCLPKSPEQWEKLVSTASVAFHLSFSAFGQLGPYLQISLASGTPAVVTKFGAGTCFPEELTFQIEPGAFEEAEIRGVLRHLRAPNFHHPREEAKAYAQTLFSRDSIASQLYSVFEHAHARQDLRQFQHRWREFTGEAESTVLNRAFQFERSAVDWIEDAFRSEVEDPAKRCWDDLGGRQ